MRLITKLTYHFGLPTRQVINTFKKINQKQNRFVFGTSLGITLLGTSFLSLCLSVPSVKADTYNLYRQGSELTQNQKQKAEELAKSACEVISSNASVKIIRTIDENNHYKTVCRNINPQKKIDNLQDHLIMTVHEADSHPNNQEVRQKVVISVYFQNYGRKIVILHEEENTYSTEDFGKTTTFIIDNRNFDIWYLNATPRPKLLKEYRQELTQILNTWENNPRQELDMTF